MKRSALRDVHRKAAARTMSNVTAIAGALFLVLTDTAARTLLAPTEVPVGVLSAFIGGPFFLYLLRRTKREYKL